MFKKLTLSKYIISLLEIISDQIYIEYILKLFLTPQKSSIYKEIYKTNCKYDMIHVGNNNWINTYSWGKGKKVVLLAHAWGANGSHMSKFVNPLLEKNYRVISFDAPAHGLSTGKTCDMFQYANILNLLSLKYSTEYIIAHSFGAACSILSIDKFKFKLKGLVTIGCFSDSQYITNNFGKILNIEDLKIRKMENLLEIKYNNIWKWREISPKNIIQNLKVPILLVHDMDDSEVPYIQLEELNKEISKSSRILTTNKLGHRKIIFHNKTISKIIDYIDKLEESNDINL